MTIEEIFPDGVWKSKEEYCIRCPVCGDHSTHDHCYCNVVKETYYCHFKGCRGNLRMLLEEHGEIELAPRTGSTEKKKYKPTDFAQFANVAGRCGTLDRLASVYLKDKRKLTDKEIQSYDIRFASFGRYYGRVLIPIYENNRVVTFIARGFLPFVEPKYLFPHHGETINTTAEAVFGYNEVVDRPRRIHVLVEGVFDAIRVDRRKKDLGIYALALMNNQLSEGQLHKLLRLKDATFLVMMDADAHKEGLRITKTLFNYGRDARLCLLKKGDPDSLTDEQMDKVINASQPFSFDLEMKIMLPESQ